VIQNTRGGSFEYYDPPESSTTAASPTLMTDHTGFRLAVDGGPQRTFGSSWGNGRAVASVLGELGANPRSSADFIRFRLVWERTL
jgi:hypothetical protein